MGSRPTLEAAAPADDTGLAPGSQANRSDGFPVRRISSGRYSFDIVDGEVLVRLNRFDAANATSLKERMPLQILGEAPRSGILRVAVPDGASLAGFMRDLRAAPEVRDVFPNAVTRGASCPTGGYDDLAWYLDRTRQRDLCRSVDCTILEDVVVAVLDTGMAYETWSDDEYDYLLAKDFEAVTFVPGYDFVNDDTHPNDDNMHGTHVASLIGALGNVVGGAPYVQLMPLKVLDEERTGTEFDLIEAIYYAVDKGADVINMSLSFGLGYYPSPALQDAVAYAAEANVVMVSSSGNDGADGVTFPAAFPDVIGVGATGLGPTGTAELEESVAGDHDDNAAPQGDMRDERTSYSNGGHALSLVAPGGRIDTDFNRDGYPDAPLGVGFEEGKPTELGYWFMAGTSQAAAQVSSAAAWLVALGATPYEAHKVMMSSARDLGQPGFDADFGAGMLDMAGAAETLVLSAEPELFGDASDWFVNTMVWLEAADEKANDEKANDEKANDEKSSDDMEHDEKGEKLRAVARVQVIDRELRPVPGITVAGSFYGSVTEFQHIAVTDANGFAYIRSGTPEFASEEASENGVVIGFQVDAVIPPENPQLGVRPYGMFSLSPAAAEVFSRFMEEPKIGESVLFFEISPDYKVVDTFVDNPKALVHSYMLKLVGPGTMAGPIVLAIDERFADALTKPNGRTVTKIKETFDQPLYSGWGYVKKVTALLVATSDDDGNLVQYLVLPVDPAMGQLDLDHTYPVVNAPRFRFQDANRILGDSIEDAGFVDEFPNSSWKGYFASVSLGDGFISSSLGTGFISSSLGTGFISSSLGTGFISSSLGTGFISSSLGTGFISSSLGVGFISSSLGAGEDQQPGSGALNIQNVDPNALITE